MNNRKSGPKEIQPAIPVLLFFVTGGAVCAMTFLLHRGYDAMLRNTVAACFGCGILLYLWYAGVRTQTIPAENARRFTRFALLYLLCLAAALALSLADGLLRPYAVIYALLLLFSNEVTGFYTGTFLLLQSVLLSADADLPAFFSCMMTGAVVCALFGRPEPRIKITAPVLTVAMTQAVFTTAFQFLFYRSDFRLNLFVFPLINLAVSALLLAAILRYYTVRVIQRDEERYLDVNDTEFSLLAAIRTKNRDEYFRAVHTAYLSDKVATELSLQAHAAKTCALYHRIGCLDDTKSVWHDVEHYYVDFEFPYDAQMLLREYIRADEEKVRSKEASVVLLCEGIVVKLLEAFAKNKNERVEYDALIDEVFAEKQSAGALSESGLTICEYGRTRELLKQEKLYYDFMR